MSGSAPEPVSGTIRRPPLRLIQGGGGSSAPQVGDEDLHAWLDGELDLDEAAGTERRLSARPDEAARAMAYRAQVTGLHALYDPVLDEPIPERLLAPLRVAGPQARTAAGYLLPAAAAAAAAVGAVAIGTFLLSDGVMEILAIF